MQIAIVLYPGLTALDAIGPYEVLRHLPGKAGEPVLAGARKLSRQIGFNPSEARAMSTVAWHRLLTKFRERRGQS